MALPTNKIKKVKLPNNTEYEIIPTTLQDGTTTNKLSVPTLSSDDEIVTTNTQQTIQRTKIFSDEVIIKNEALAIFSDNYSSYTGDDWDTKFYADKILVENAESGNTTVLQFPEFSGETKTIAVTTDIQNVEIVDLTSVN